MKTFDMKREYNEESATWKQYNMNKRQHENSATQALCHMKKV